MEAPSGWEPHRLRAVLECLLFVATEPVTPRQVAQTLSLEEAEAGRALEELRLQFTNGGGLQVVRVAGGYQMCTRPEYADAVARFLRPGAHRLSRQALETLAIIAYRQPVTGPEVQELRNVNSAGVLKTLLERRLVRITGRKEVVGKPFLYGTTKEFLVHFGLNSLRDLPPLAEFEETFGAVGGEGGPEPSAATLEAFAPQPEEGAETDREEIFMREVAELEEAAETAITAEPE
jgi:segregation and condensation protein B